MLRYARRRNQLESGEHEWLLDEAKLVSRSADGRERSFHISDIVNIRYEPAGSRFREWRHRTILGLRDSSSITLANDHFVSTHSYENRTAEYEPFVQALIGQIADISPYARRIIGPPYLAFVGTLAAVATVFLALAALIFLLPIEGVEHILWIKLALLVVSAIPLYAWLLQSRPQGTPIRAALADWERAPQPGASTQPASEMASQAMELDPPQADE